MIEINEELAQNLLMDMKKKQVDKIERAKFIQSYMKERKLSIRGLAKETGITKSCIEDWLLWLRITPEQKQELTKTGVRETEVYHELRNNKGVDSQEIISKLKNNKELELREAIKGITKFLKNNAHLIPKEANIIDDIKDLRNAINKTLMYLEKEDKNHGTTTEL